MAEDLGALASTPSGLPTDVQPGLFLPPHALLDTLPTAEDSVNGSVGQTGFGGPSGGNNSATPGAMTTD